MRSLHSRFIAIVLVTATCSGAIVGLGAYKWAYRHSVDNGMAAISSLADAIEKTASIGAFAHDRVLMQELADGMARHKLVAVASISDHAGIDVVAKARSPDAGEAEHAVLDRPLRSPFDPSETVGTLSLRANAHQLRAEAGREAAAVAVSMLALTVLLVMVLNAVALRFLSRPMKRLADDLARMEAGTSQRIEVTPAHEHDELGTVASAANRLLQANEAALARERQMRAEITEMEARYRRIFDFSSAGIFVLSMDGELVNCNTTVNRLLGLEDGAMAAGRKDFLDHCFADPQRVRQMIVHADQGSTASADLQLRCADGGTRWAHTLISTHATRDAAMPRFVEGVIYDVTQRRLVEHAAAHRAEHDPLTGLKNRACVESSLDQSIVGAQAKGNAVTLMYIDLDGFKRVNDDLGHGAGDEVLVECARRLRALARRSNDLIGRIGGDELVIMLEGIPADAPLAQELAARTVDLLSRPITLADGQIAVVGASVGVASYPAHGTTPTELLQAADAAMYAAKRNGKNQYRIAGHEAAHGPAQQSEAT